MSNFFEETSQPYFISHIQNKEEVLTIEEGIIKNCEIFREGLKETIAYDFEAESFGELREKYHVEEIAGDGSEFDKATRIMDDFSKRLTHKGNFEDYTKDMNGLYLLDYALDHPENGIYCRAKAQIFNEVYLSLGIYSRKLWIMPLSVYDQECHVVNEIWDSEREKWIMLDTTNNLYWVDENKKPLTLNSLQ